MSKLNKDKPKVLSVNLFRSLVLVLLQVGWKLFRN